jgi:two-component system cell cycle sensor histidine kinase/response regulator CckA
VSRPRDARESPADEVARLRAELAQARETLFERYDLAPVGLLSLDGRGRVTAANLRAGELLGVPRGELLGRRLGALLGGGSLLFETRRHLAMTSGEAMSCELLVDRGPLTLELIPAGEGCEIAIHTHAGAQENELGPAQLTALLELLGVGTLVMGADDQVIAANTTAAHVFGYDGWAALIGVRGLGSTLTRAGRAAFDLDRGGGPVAREVIGVHADGTSFPLQIAVCALDDVGARRIVLLHDLSAVRRLETGLAGERALSQRLAAAVPRAVVQLDAAGRVVHVNRYLQAASGGVPLGGAFVDLPSVDRTKAAVLLASVHDHAPIAVDLGGAFGGPELEWRAAVVHDAAGRQVGTVLLGEPTGAQLRVEELVRVEVDLVGSASDVVMGTDFEGLLQLWNPAAERLFGWRAAEAVGREVAALLGVDAATRALIDRELGESGACRHELRLRTRDGDHVEADIAFSALRDAEGRRVGTCVIARDVGHVRALEREVARSRHLGAVGQVASAVAHDFNNLLMGIMGGCRLALGHDPDGANRELLQQMLESARRSSGVARELLDFARPAPHDAEAVVVDTLVERLRPVLQSITGEDIALTVTPEAQATAVRGVPSRIEQLVLNLVVNARDAMPRGGALWVETGLDQGMVVLTVRDTGEGMSAEAMERCFDPFFTTKPAGRGTGLGLAQVAELVRDMGGGLGLESTPGRGTCFTIALPPDDTAEQQPVGEEIPRGAAERVLLVEDDALVRRAVGVELVELGYQVDAAADAASALALLDEDRPVSLLLSDVRLPGIDGLSLVEAVRARRPGLPVVLMSADSGGAARAQGLPCLAKPFTTEALARQLRAALDVVGAD